MRPWNLTRLVHNHQQVQITIEGAIKRATDYFLNDKSEYYRSHKVWFKTRVKNPSGGLSKCMVLASPEPTRNTCGVMLLPGDFFCTHEFDYDGTNLEGRLKVKVKEFTSLVDPFDFRYSEFLPFFCTSHNIFQYTYSSTCLYS